MAKQKYTKLKNWPTDGLRVLKVEKLIEELGDYHPIEDQFLNWLDRFVPDADRDYYLKVDRTLISMPSIPKYVVDILETLLEMYGECYIEIRY